MLPHQYKELSKAVERLLREGDLDQDVAALNARRILKHRAGLDWSDIIAHPQNILEGDIVEQISEDVRRCQSGEPLSRIYGTREFWGLEFELSSDTLDPRPDTELIVELVLKEYADHHPDTILDLGTGSGCILISLLHEMKISKGIGIDKSIGAVNAARRNALANGIKQERISFLCGSWMDSIAGKFDLIVSNPPYIANPEIANLGIGVKNYDPILALDGGQDGLQAYKAIFSSLKKHMKSQGKAYFEIGFDQEENVVRLAEESGLIVIDTHRDLSGQPRVVEISSGDK